MCACEILVEFFQQRALSSSYITVKTGIIANIFTDFVIQ